MLRKLNILFCLLLVCSPLIFAQKKDDPFPLKPKNEIKKPYCEFNALELESLAKKIRPTDFLIIVSHLGDGEKKSFTLRRLYNAKNYFTTSPYNRSATSILTAGGESVTGNGYIDFYVKGELELRIYVNKNAEFLVTSCIVDPPNSRCSSERERLFYPCKSKNKRLIANQTDCRRFTETRSWEPRKPASATAQTHSHMIFRELNGKKIDPRNVFCKNLGF